ncbi:uncharacterized protein [Pyrus communis]|uniref:uncharacterized protein n=1 Tax=Pyrus communis TaxID=23211 RepID=UPI0035BFAA0C
MLCFGNYDQTHGNSVEFGFSETAKKSAAACSESSSVSSTSTASINALLKSNNKRQNGSALSSTTTPKTQRAAKKTKSENPTSAGNGKRREGREGILGFWGKGRGWVFGEGEKAWW